MEKRKTLNELQKAINFSLIMREYNLQQDVNNVNYGKGITREVCTVMKKEAIKWIKDFREILQLHKDHVTLYGKICDEQRSQRKYPIPETDSRITKLNDKIEEKETTFKFLFCDEYDCQTNFINFIKHFFNITEEDLK